MFIPHLQLRVGVRARGVNGVSMIDMFTNRRRRVLTKSKTLNRKQRLDCDDLVCFMSAWPRTMNLPRLNGARKVTVFSDGPKIASRKQNGLRFTQGWSNHNAVLIASQLYRR